MPSSLTIPGALSLPGEVALPAMVEVVQQFPRPGVPDVEGAVRGGLRAQRLDLRGKRIAVTAGSRGIRDVVPALRGAISALREAGASPVVVASMGSHGGGTAEGQRRLLGHLGISEEEVGAPIVSTMEVVELGRTAGGYVVYLDRAAASCEGILAVNRIKPHTAFQQPFGSGLMKMLAVGLGKAQGAAQAHRAGAAGMAAAIREVAEAIIRSGRIVGGVAIVENAYDETGLVEVIAPERIVERELELFGQAQSWMPALPVERIDVLIIDEIGKNYSGTGMDVNVIGRWRHPEIPDPPSPQVSRIVALRLSEESEGNAQGVGLADVITARLASAIDLAATYTNAVTSTYLERAFLPLIAPTDRTAIEAALRSLDPEALRRPRIVRIPNTLHLERLLVSEEVAGELHGRPAVTIGRTRTWEFSAQGDLSGASGRWADPPGPSSPS